MAQPNQVTVDIDDDEPAEVTPRHNALHRLDSVSRPAAPNRNNLGLGDRLNSVFREIRPLVEHARMVCDLYILQFSYCYDAIDNNKKCSLDLLF